MSASTWIVAVGVAWMIGLAFGLALMRISKDADLNHPKPPDRQPQDDHYHPWDGGW